MVRNALHLQPYQAGCAALRNHDANPPPLQVSVHTSNLANAQFLQPGSAVFEIIQRNWFWHGLDRSFQVCAGSQVCAETAAEAGLEGQAACTSPNQCDAGRPEHACTLPTQPAPQVQTDTMGDIHHFAWRATGANETRYIEPRDEARFGDWEPLQCNTEECVEVRRGGGTMVVGRQGGRNVLLLGSLQRVFAPAGVTMLCMRPALPRLLTCGPTHSTPSTAPPQAHTNVDVIVDIPAFRALLADRLPLVFAGWPVEAAALPWPEQEGAAEAEAEDFVDEA